ncbi:hypothetical protein CSKR_100828 [Clonorchis sinensis]|uniref:Uncharacterized protein n=1 Tax=Clonorchis sinensis TaxID=79923 RepID=A0A3R7K0C1_CLOSI|nr:hypothetical protein CSKR_100828 [Clonorchis sinensis]
MSNEGAYLSFKRAFDEQRCEIQRLYDRVAKLEEANAKVLTYVKQTGNLPLLDGETIKCQVTPDTRPQSNDVSINSIADVNPNLSAKSVFYSARMSERCGTPEISAIVGQQTKEVEKALNNLDLEPVKRMQILNQVQSNLSAILYSQLASADMGFRASPNALDINTSNPSYHTPFMNGSIAVSCGDEMTITGTQPLIKSPGPITEHRPNSSRDIFTTDPAGSRTPVNPTPPPPPDVQERRRQELYRTNLRMHTTMRDQTREATVNADLAEEPTPVGRSSIVPPFLQNLLPVPSPRTKSTFGSVPGSGDETHPSPISTLRALNAKEYTGTKNTREFICPCKSEATCPLNPAKRCRFANDSRVARGFTLLAAAFRGRFIRQLLATHKVFDLIRTVKDSAKLALSIHVERAASGSKINDQKSSEFGLQADRYGRFSNEELALESRLLAQLRGALVQLHDIFFSWPLTSQIELLNVSRSLPQRNRRPLGKSGIPLEDQHSSGAKSDSFADDWTARDHYDQRRRKPSGLRCSQSQSEPEENGETRLVLSDSLSHPQQEDKPLDTKQLVIGHSGSSSLTKLIDSVRRSWPDHPKTEHKSLPFQPNVDRQSFRLGQVSGGPMVRAGNGGNISERSNQSSNHNRRPISGQLGQRRLGVTDPEATGGWYPVRRRIVASYCPNSFADTADFIPYDSSTRLELHPYTPSNHQSYHPSVANSTNTPDVSGADCVVPVRRLNRWGDEEADINCH